MKTWTFVLALFSLIATAQDKVIEKHYKLSDKDVQSKNLTDLTGDSSKLVFRIWIEPDLIIEVGQQVSITLYSQNYSKTEKEYTIDNVKRIFTDIPAQNLLKYFDTIDLAEWDDALSPVMDSGGMAKGVIHDGHLVIIEFSTKEKYRSFSLYGPLTDQSTKSKKTLELINFLDEQINPDKMRLEYYCAMPSTDKKSKRLCKSIQEYKDYYKEQIDKKIFPKMWGTF